MKKRFYRYFPLLFITGELLVLLVSFILAYFLTFGNTFVDNGRLFVFGLYAGIWILVIYSSQGYKIGRSSNYQETLKRSVLTQFIFWSILSFVWILFESYRLERELLIQLFVVLFFAVSFYRISVHLALNQYRKLGGNFRNAVIIGYDSLGLRLYEIFSNKPHYGIKCQGFYEIKNNHVKPSEKTPVLGSVSDFLQSDISKLDLIYVSEKIDRLSLTKIIHLADSHLKKVKLIPQFNTDILKTYTLSRFEDISIVDVNDLPLDSAVNRFLKRGFDIAFASFVIIFILSWLYPIIALLIKLESKGPVLFRQMRHGKGKEPFVCLKFRTMVINDQADKKWATRNDPRVTKIGSVLRRTSLDELPQFINVLRGDMSIVGPRPHPIPLNRAYENSVYKFTQRHASRPGITGLAQALGYRGEIQKYHQMSSRVKLDRFYLQNWSFVLDIKIIFLTVYSILFDRQNAY